MGGYWFLIITTTELCPFIRIFEICFTVLGDVSLLVSSSSSSSSSSSRSSLRPLLFTVEQRNIYQLQYDPRKKCGWYMQLQGPCRVSTNQPLISRFLHQRVWRVLMMLKQPEFARFLRGQVYTRWWFQLFYIFTTTWRRFPI